MVQSDNQFLGTTYHVLVPGELCLGDAQLAEGYLNLPQKTQDVFTPNPFEAGRLYRTGDMVVVNEDGTIDLIGRIDQQVKINGVRVEPNEANSIIQVQPGVIQSYVVPASTLNRKVLVVVIVPEKNREWTSFIRDMRSKLSTQLPQYSIPRYWVQQAKLPLNVSGKVDIFSLVMLVELMDADESVAGSNIATRQPSPLILPLLAPYP